MEFENLSDNIGRKVSMTINKNYVVATIKSCDKLGDEKWVTFSVENEYRLYTPTVYGIHIGNFNCLYEPDTSRMYKGWYSNEVFETVKLL